MNTEQPEVPVNTEQPEVPVNTEQPEVPVNNVAVPANNTNLEGQANTSKSHNMDDSGFIDEEGRQTIILTKWYCHPQHKDFKGNPTTTWTWTRTEELYRLEQCSAVEKYSTYLWAQSLEFRRTTFTCKIIKREFFI